MDIFGHTPIQLILFSILYGVTGVVPFFAALYLLLRRGNAFAPDITPPIRLRSWAASFFAVFVLGHVWWLLFYIFSSDIHSGDGVLHSAGYVMVVVLDWLTLLTTIVGTLFSMLQDRRRSVWPVVVAMIPFVLLGGVFMVYPSNLLVQIAVAYVILFSVIFAIYMVFAVRRNERWLNDNYADLENKKVWLSQVVMLGCLLLFILYTLVDTRSFALLCLIHLTELVLFGLLLWRVETLPQLPALAQQPSLANPVNIELSRIEQMLTENCVATQLYLRRDLTLLQLAQAIGFNRVYLSYYFSSQGISYNTYINNLRINYFISRYQEVAASGLPFTVQQLASDSGYRSYSTFSLAFKKRMGQSVTAWMRNMD